MPSGDGGPECYLTSDCSLDSAGCFAETVSPEERPVIRRCTHGTRNSRVHWALAAQVSRRREDGQRVELDGRDGRA